MLDGKVDSFVKVMPFLSPFFFFLPFFFSFFYSSRRIERSDQSLNTMIYRGNFTIIIIINAPRRFFLYFITL